MLAKACLLVCLPLSLGAQPLAGAGPLSFGDGGRDALAPPLAQGRLTRFELPFHLSTSARVVAEAEGLRSIDQGPDAAPEVFIDEQYLGAMHAAHGATWRGPQSPLLAPGAHRLIVRNASVQDAEDFVLRRIFVYANAPEAKPRAKVPDLGPQGSPRPLTENGCASVPRRDWPAAKKTGITLSVLSGQVIPTGELVRLKSGEAWACGLKISARSSKPLALLAGFHPQGGDRGRWLFSLDPDPAPVVEEKGYKPARWERFHVELCDGNLAMRFGQNPPLRVPWPQPEISFEIAAQSVEVALRPLP